MRQAENILEMDRKLAPNHLRFIATLYPSLEIAFEMRPTHLPMQRITPVVGTVAIRPDDTGKVAAQQFLGSPGNAVFENAKRRRLCGLVRKPLSRCGKSYKNQGVRPIGLYRLDKVVLSILNLRLENAQKLVYPLKIKCFWVKFSASPLQPIVMFGMLWVADGV